MAANRQTIRCRGENARRILIEKYDLTLVAHVKLLNGQKKQSCTGDALTDSYYCFSYTNRRKRETGSFLCGSHAARHFRTLLKIDDIPQFNPLKQEGGSSNYSVNKETNPVIKWNKKAKQLHDAINLLVVCWDTVPGKALSRVKCKIERYSYKEPFLTEIKAVNTIISYDKKGRSLRRMLEELSQKNNLRDFSFDELKTELEKDNTPSHFG